MDANDIKYLSPWDHDQSMTAHKACTCSCDEAMALEGGGPN